MDKIEKSLAGYLKEKPNLKYIFFGGKGGVGKTVMAGAFALAMAKLGKKVMLASTNPVHSLSSLLDMKLDGVTQARENLAVYEIDTTQTIARMKQEISEKIRWFLKFADISLKADDFVETATLNPAFEESAMFENMVNLIFENKYEVYVFDTAPTANARRLLGMSKVYTLWVNKMLQSRKEATSLRKVLSFRKKEEKDPLMEYLLSFQGRIQQAKELLSNPDLTSFFFITLPEALPIAVIKRFIEWFREFGIPVGGVIVNELIEMKEASGTPEFVLNRVKMQKEYMQVIYQDFPDLRAIVPLFEQEVTGFEMLDRVAERLFSTA
ncbi:arsenic transporter [Candidatus Desantisbacteria bacterium CG_4_10_14_0_8_um_filter_48_22]|uniref:Arsenic transporter n=1 Tax=Candidatus Desantisbacteria bacterium CG_4_10_14_0_8_um_filter_48_22 TaxID=1974543 RepID=A0A2M7SFN2_9BACT|nr:MAG: hypothetical protein AUJ67_08170 [Candidatus Desantisbacteria bacterium CG1_02_49_89]PIZ18271.1 MAG: arsenic transporter [Candidatus Desantisbacteria bacterium CG_4_10_14_0_8_um_filter_48_22]PJB29008.1 MAG: arsenic transporter [Candidatus Desantisbacteria bacterium CG_4_9_14_3_um_filter_50_7]